MKLERIEVQQRPPNAEAPFEALHEHPTPRGLFYLRCNFDIPLLDAGSYALEIGGAVDRTARIGLDALQQAATTPLECTLECAGNGRTAMDPVPEGTPWGLGAISSARFRGVPLCDVLAPLGVSPGAREILFVGHDSGAVGSGGIEHFARSLPLEEALREDVILAWEMNGQPLTAEHGAPLRLVVPGWYGIASVKWLSRIDVLERPFEGHFQKDRYVYRGDPFDADGTPVTRMRVRSLILEPRAGASAAAGRPVEIRGLAISGSAPIATVDVRIDDGDWQPATLEPQASPYLHAYWSFTLPAARAGAVRVTARATDGAGNHQPLDTVSNLLGYGNNAAHAVTFHVH
jgi:DMSO/TMAO reductase YedYZ molybdopterin-dependent catalytic subunit